MGKPKKNKSLFDQVFGRTFESIDPGEGMDPIKIDSTSIIHIPGVIKHWQQEIENRRKEIIKYKNRGFLERIVDWIDEGNEFDDASGDELYDLSPSKAAEEIMERLEDDPMDMKSRLELVSLVGRSRQDLTIEMLRDLLLQATVACSFGEISNLGIQVVLKAQEAYLKKMLKQCLIDQEKLEKILDEPLSDNTFSKQRKQIKQYVDKIKRNMELIQFYLAYTVKGFSPLQTGFSVQLEISEIQDLIDEGENRSNRKVQRVFSKANVLVSTLRYAILLHGEAQRYIPLLSKLDPSHPLPAIIKARLARTRLIFLFHQYKVGEKGEQIDEDIANRFNLVCQYYQQAVGVLGKGDKDLNSAVIDMEFADLILDMAGFLDSAGFEKIPMARIVRLLMQADELLLGHKGNKKATELLKSVRLTLEELDS